MAQEKYAHGIASVKFGTPTGTASMPGTLNAWAQTVAGSMTLSEDEATLKDFKVEETTTPIKTVVTDSGGLTAKWRGYDLTPALVAVVKGGTAGTGGTGATAYVSYAGPVQVVAVDLALEITTVDDVVFEIYNCAVVARFDGSISRENLLEIEVTASAQDPGDGGSPYMYRLPNPS